MPSIDRAQFLRLGALGVGTGLVSAPVATAATPAPKDDDIGFIQFGAVAELVSLKFFRMARQAPAVNGAPQQRLAQARDAKLRQFWMLNGILGTDAIQADDFEIVMPQEDFATRDGVLALGEEIEALLVGTYLSGVHNTEDRATRLLLGQLLAYDAQLLTWIRERRGARNPARMPVPVSLEEAGPKLDRFLAIPGVPPS